MVERGIVPMGGVSRPEDEELDMLVEAGLAAGRAAGGGAAGRALQEVLQLEAAAWGELDAVAALVLRVRGQRSPLPFGLLQLRPPPALKQRAQQQVPDAMQQQDGQQQQQQAHAAAGLKAAAAPGAQASSGAYAYAYSASDGLDVHADPLLPPLRRAARFSFALASILDLAPGEGKQALLEHSSIAGRLRAGILKLMRQRKVLAALAAVAGVARRRKGEGDHEGGSSKGA